MADIKSEIIVILWMTISPISRTLLYVLRDFVSFFPSFLLPFFKQGVVCVCVCKSPMNSSTLDASNTGP